MVDAMTKSMLGLTTGLQAASLVGANLKALKKKKKNMFGLGVTNLVGTGLIGAQAGMISGL